MSSYDEDIDAPEDDNGPLSEVAADPFDDDADLTPEAPDDAPEDGDDDEVLEKEAPAVPIPGSDAVEAEDNPLPATPTSTPDQAQARVEFERLVNSEAELFAQTAREQYIIARLAGHSIVITVDDDEDD